MIYHLRCVGTRLISRQFRTLTIGDRAYIHKTHLLNSGKINAVNMERIIAIGQMCATNNKLANRQQVQQIVESAVQQEACVSVFERLAIELMGISVLNKLMIFNIIDDSNVIKKILSQFVFLPECCDYVGSNRDETIALAEPLNGETVTFYRELARKNNIWLSLGGVHEAICSEVDSTKMSPFQKCRILIQFKP